MPKKIIALVSASLLLISLGIFTVSNAFALNYYDWASWAPGTEAKPLSSQMMYKEDCKNLKSNYKQNVTSIKAKALSLQLSKEDIKMMAESVRYDRDHICAFAQDLSTLERMCKALRKDYGKEIQRIKAKGLSSQMSQGDIQNMIKQAKNYKKDICKQAQLIKKKRMNGEDKQEDSSAPSQPTAPTY